MEWLFGRLRRRKACDSATAPTFPAASIAGGVSTARAADAFTANVLPIIASIQAAGAGTLHAIAAELNTW